MPGATKKALDRWMRLREKALAGLAPAEEAEFSNLSELLRAASIDTPPTWLYLETASFPFEVADQQDYPITLSIDVAGTPTEVTVLVLSRILPSDSSWSPAELHIHTNTSDGSSTPANIATLYSSAGCRVAYVTDHSDGIATKTWAQYSYDVNAATITGVISLYPGAEVEVGTFTYDEFGNPIFTAAGHSLAYGVASLTGLTNRFYTPQGEIDQVLANNNVGPLLPRHRPPLQPRLSLD